MREADLGLLESGVSFREHGNKVPAETGSCIGARYKTALVTAAIRRMTITDV